MPPTKNQSEWVERVLGIKTQTAGAAPAASAPREALKASIASLTARTAKIAEIPRPSAPPRQQATEKLLSAFVAKPAPEDPGEAPAHVAEFLPAFLVSMEIERPAASQKLAAGSAVPGADQLLGIADLFAASQRATIEWETLLDQAEAADSTLDVIEEQEEQRDEAQYGDTLLAYNTRRKQTIAAEAKAMKLMADLQGAFNSLSDSAQAAAMTEAGRNA